MKHRQRPHTFQNFLLAHALLFITFFSVHGVQAANVNQPAVKLNVPALGESGVVRSVSEIKSNRLRGYSSSASKLKMTLIKPVDLLDRMRRGFVMADLPDDPLVKEYTETLLRNRGQLRNQLSRAGPYLYYLISELERQNLPTELALLPIVESDFNPFATSIKGAAGIWQFMPTTGAAFKLQQNEFLDQRRDLQASTRAALFYLKRLYGMHKDWHLALASYNWGENAVLNAVNNNRNNSLMTDFSSLSMPRETRSYLPRLLAWRNVIADYYGSIDLPAIPNSPYLSKINNCREIDVALAARLSGLPINDFISLNASYSRLRVMAGGGIIVPRNNAQVFIKKVRAFNGPLVGWSPYFVQNAEPLAVAADKFRVSASSLAKLNTINEQSKLLPGQMLLVPVSPETINYTATYDSSAPISGTVPGAAPVTPGVTPVVTPVVAPVVTPVVTPVFTPVSNEGHWLLSSLEAGAPRQGKASKRSKRRHGRI